MSLCLYVFVYLQSRWSSAACTRSYKLVDKWNGHRIVYMAGLFEGKQFIIRLVIRYFSLKKQEVLKAHVIVNRLILMILAVVLIENNPGCSHIHFIPATSLVKLKTTSYFGIICWFLQVISLVIGKSLSFNYRKDLTKVLLNTTLAMWSRFS